MPKGSFRRQGKLLDWEKLENDIKKHGIHNATTTTIAPTGTISIIAGVSSGIEPLFAVSYFRNVLDGKQLIEVNPLFAKMAKDEGFYSESLMQKVAEKGSVQGIREIPLHIQKLFITAHEVAADWHLQMQAAFQNFTDNAVSKTINLKNSATVEDIEKIYQAAHQYKLKGVTIYRDGSREGQVLSVKKQAPKSEEVTGGDQGINKRERAQILNGKTMVVETGCGKLYVTINYDEVGAFELFVTMGKAGGCAASQCEAIGRLVSLCWRYNIQPEEVVKQLVGIRCHKPFGYGPNKVLSCADALAKSIKAFLEENGLYDDQINEDQIHFAGHCPECGSVLEPEGGCSVCHGCGFSLCG
jgi:ribonucleoside-diphosphate reductase alpha chain